MESHDRSGSTGCKAPAPAPAPEGAVGALHERDYCTGIASQVSSSYPGEADLELGLSLGAKTKVAARHCRILTAKDFPSMLASRGSPISSSASSSASSSPAPGGGDGGGEGARVGVGVVGTKRSADSVAPHELRHRSPSQVVGWPPIRAYRVNSLMNHSKNNLDDDSSSNGHHTKAGGSSANVHGNGIPHNASCKKHEKQGLVGASLFVKINMDGMPIGRKVDLNAHRTYETLALALEDMFQKPSSLNNSIRSARTSSLLDGSSEFVLTYEDRDGGLVACWGCSMGCVLEHREKT